MTLMERVLVFDIDGATVEFPFVERLARENDWSLQYAERVVLEYKRFLIMAIEAEHVVTPSEEVDQAWHLHLCYTHSYWDRLCKEVLGQPLHHNPTQGGKAEAEKYWSAYEETLATYSRLFGSSPPNDIWPEASRRFASGAYLKRINIGEYWLVPKVRFMSSGKRIIFGLACILLLMGCATTNVLSEEHKAYIVFGVLVFIVLVILIIAIRNRKKGGGNGGGCASFWGCGGGGCNSSNGCSGGSGCGGGGCGGD